MADVRTIHPAVARVFREQQRELWRRACLLLVGRDQADRRLAGLVPTAASACLDDPGSGTSEWSRLLRGLLNDATACGHLPASYRDLIASELGDRDTYVPSLRFGLGAGSSHSGSMEMPIPERGVWSAANFARALEVLDRKHFRLLEVHYGDSTLRSRAADVLSRRADSVQRTLDRVRLKVCEFIADHALTYGPSVLARCRPILDGQGGSEVRPPLTADDAETTLADEVLLMLRVEAGFRGNWLPLWFEGAVQRLGQEAAGSRSHIVVDVGGSSAGSGTGSRMLRTPPVGGPPTAGRSSVRVAPGSASTLRRSSLSRTTVAVPAQAASNRSRVWLVGGGAAAVVVLLLLIVLLRGERAAPAAVGPRQVAAVIEVKGPVQVERDGKQLAAEYDGPVFSGDRLRTAAGGSVAVTYAPEMTILRLGAETLLGVADRGGAKVLDLGGGSVDMVVAEQAPGMTLAVTAGAAQAELAAGRYRVTRAGERLDVLVTAGQARVRQSAAGPWEVVQPVFQATPTAVPTPVGKTSAKPTPTKAPAKPPQPVRK